MAKKELKELINSKFNEIKTEDDIDKLLVYLYNHDKDNKLLCKFLLNVIDYDSFPIYQILLQNINGMKHIGYTEVL